MGGWAPAGCYGVRVNTGARGEGRDPGRLTFSFTENDDGWVTAQIVEYPAAISQGSTSEEARRNVLEALHDLTHEATLAERVAFTVDAALSELGALASDLVGFAERLLGSAAERARIAADRDRTGVH